MKKRIFYTVFTLFLLITLLTQSVFAITHTVVIKPEYTEDTVVAIDFKGGRWGDEYVYTGEKIKPEIVVTKIDKSIADPSEYTVTYDDDCETLGVHYVTVEYLKSGYKISLDYWVVPGTTKKVDMTAKNGKVTLSWASVKGATAYRVLEYNSSSEIYVEVPWEDGSIAAPKLSRTFSNLEPGKTYNMAIMALQSVSSMPTKQIKTFKFTVPEDGEGSFNIIPGIKETTTIKPTKPETTIKETQKVSVVSTSAPHTEAKVPSTKTETTVTETTLVETTITETTLVETTLVETTTETTISETTSPTEVPTIETTIAETLVFAHTKADSNIKKLIPALVAIILSASAITAFIIFKKKKK